MLMFMPAVTAILTRNERYFGIAVGDQIFWGCKILILPKSNQICQNLINFATKNFARRCGSICWI